MMRQRIRKLTTLATFLTIVCMALVACGPQATPTPEPVAEAEPAEAVEAEPAEAEEAEPAGDPIKIGWISPRSGAAAINGEWDERGVIIAFEEKNAAGGIHGRPLVLIQEDDEADPSKAVNLAKKLITQEGIVAAFACTNSTPSLAVVPVFEEYKVPHITAALNQEITERGSEFVFRNTPPGPAWEDAIVDFMVSQGYTKFALLADTTAFGRGEADHQEAALARHGIEPLAREFCNLEDKDFTGQVTKILRTDPEVILLGAPVVGSGLIAKQARQLGFTGLFAGGAPVANGKFLEVAGDAAEGLYYSCSHISNDLNDETRAFAAKYKERWDAEAECHGVRAYDGANILILALERAYPNITGETVAAELHKVCGYQGLQGEFCYDEHGEGIFSVQIGIVKDGKLTEYDGE